MKTLKSKLAILISAICSGALLVASGLSAAWFYQENKIELEDGLTGSVLQKYFHDGDGSEENPFIITRPRHYENMVLLHYNLEGFAEKEFYFEFGADLNGDGEKEMYNYTNGKVDYSVNDGYSKVLNCDRIASLAPLGSLEKPFNAHIQGNNMTISGFKIDATRGKYSDIGIFGFVGHGTCLNAYFSDFEIDTTGTEYEEPTAEEIENDTAHIHQKNAVHFGYIAGHLDETQNFQNVYVNNCTIKGRTNGLHLNNYGYYGKAEQDALGGGLGIGRDYKFSLNSQAVFNYLNTTYDSIKDQQLVLRNTRDTYGLEENENGDKIKRMTTDGQHIIPVSQAISPDSAAGSDTFVINDGYSLSTTGYATPEFIEQKHEYNAYYKDRDYVADDGDDRSHDGAYKAPANQPFYYDHSLKGSGEGLIVNTETHEEAPTPYYYWNEEQNCFFYGESYDRQVLAGYDVYNFKCSFKSFDKTFETSIFKTVDVSEIKIDARLYWDDDGYQYDSNANNIQNNYIKLNLKPSLSSANNVFTKKWTITFTCDPFVIGNVQEGKHHYSSVLTFSYPKSATGIAGTGTQYYVLGNYDSSSNVLNQSEILVNDTNNGIGFDLSKYSTVSNESTYNELIQVSNDKIKRTEFVFDPQELLPHVDTRTFESPIVFKEVIDGVEQDGFVTIAELNQSHYSSFIYTPAFNGSVPVWKFFIVRRDVVENPETKEYFVTDDTLIYESGYRHKNIDVVGGGAEFYYQNTNLLGNQIEISVLSLTSEKNAGDSCGVAPAKGTLFFANEHCKSSLVVYLKNTSNAIDGRNDALGKISFTYVQASILGYQIEVVEPSFKKGDAFCSLKSAGTNITESDDSGFINVTHTIGMDLMEEDIQKVSYCALDAEGKVLGRYNADGTTSMTKEEQVKIDTYVLVLGGQSDNNYDTWITNIDFEYKAQDGFGGSFGTIGYRDATDTIESTILNYYLENPSESGNYIDYTYYVNVRFVKNDDETEGAKKGTYYITCYADTEVTLKIYNYYSESYDVYVKTDPSGEFGQVSGSTPTVSVTASSESSW